MSRDPTVLTRALRVLFVLALLMIALQVWVTPLAPFPAAEAIPDSGAQRAQLLEEAKRTNELLARLVEHLEKRPVRVTIESTSSAPGASH